MSSTLMWEKVTLPDGNLPDELKRAISRRLWDTDGSCGNGDAIVDQTDVEYIKGLKDAGIKGAGELIKLIEKYDTIRLWHEH